ncbi:MAG TPA: thiamine biosynthesis protein [Desulfobacteraceae bacterium]|nr:thiamine biosynthesis protein [Desulfobacteraceae bacterium]
MKQVAAVGLFSGGLDSILACRMIQAQGINVFALKFVTPFFDDHLLGRREEYCAEILEKYGITAQVVDLTRGYVELLKNPKYGFGKNFNPCVDCKIFMLTRAREMMDEFGAAFLITGEVLGQRPMSQRRDTLRVIERESGCEDILFRPLCAKRLPETKPEREGLVDRARLLDFTGRGRRRQMELAAEFGIREYPGPAGGCILTDPNLGARIDRYYRDRVPSGDGVLRENDIRLLLLGRQFLLPGGYWFILGRNQQENERIQVLAKEEDWLLTMTERPGPTGLLRRPGGTPSLHQPVGDGLCRLAAGLVVRFGGKKEGKRSRAEVLARQAGKTKQMIVEPLEDSRFIDWRF